MLKNRQQLAELFNTLEFRVGAEVGVFDGYYSEILCNTILGLKLYSIDPWAVYAGYRDHKFEESMRNAEEKARARLKPFNVTIIKKFSEEAANEIEDSSLDFVYIDANHEYKYVKQDLELWTPKVRKGGIVAGDDYYMTQSKNFGVIKAIHEFVSEHNYQLEITGWDLSSPKEDDQQPQFWFVKDRE